jgi:hypothetical protein
MGKKGRHACAEVDGLGILELAEEQCWSLYSEYNYLKTVLTDKNQKHIIDHLKGKYSLPKFQIFQESKDHHKFFADMSLTLPNEQKVTIKAAVYQIDDAGEDKIVIYVPNSLEQEEAFKKLRVGIEGTPKRECIRDTCREEHLRSMKNKGNFSCIFLKNISLSRFCSHRTRKGKTVVSVNEITATVALDTQDGERDRTPPPTRPRQKREKSKTISETTPPREITKRSGASGARVPTPSAPSPEGNKRLIASVEESQPDGAPSIEDMDQRLIENLFSMLPEEPTGPGNTNDFRDFRTAASNYELPQSSEASVQLKKINVEWSPELDLAKKVERILFRGSLPSPLDYVFGNLPERSREKAAAYPFEFESEHDLIVDSILATLWIATLKEGSSRE